jgi:hypothetical protein
MTLYSVPDPDLNPVDPLLIGLLDPDPYYFIKVSKIFLKVFGILIFFLFTTVKYL